LSPKPVLVSWSGGKDCVLALHELRTTPGVEAVGLFTTIGEADDRIAIHGVHRKLLERQAEALGLPLHLIPIPDACPNAIYEERVAAALAPHRDRGVRSVAFGDLFLEDLRVWREGQMAALGMEPLFPLWRRETAGLARDFLHRGFRAVVVSVDTAALDLSFAGRHFNEDLLRDLPPGIDPCGENGEFHTFVHAGPVFRQPVGFRAGSVEVRGRFALCDLEPGAQASISL
jgi:uncharacterized protein (TIGR00290 family)